ncbi:Potassium efflux system KefA protein / Small-conductance mechanosensitive channel [hydrothermal vent metagenome]|uniref:Potassium efflux system KefA protein / Small-conductance mechanosensitive channel n=1 Tax=hydrothermal vent metagenome TaxID=652676 RepID=A0A1W1CEJ4_9ZZZZ
MEKIEEFLLLSYEKILLYLNGIWSNTLKSIEEFDFTILAKVGLIILFGYLLALLLSRYIPKGIKALGKKFAISINQELIIALRSFIFKLILFIFILVAINLFELPKNIVFIASALVKSILILSLVGFSLKMIKLILTNMANKPRVKRDEDSVQIIQKSTLPLFENTALIIFSIGGIYQVFAIWNVDMTALLAGAGIGAMAIGMAAQNTLSDIIAGILILSGAPYRVGDVVYVRENLKGKVTQIGLRNTRLVTRNNIEIIVPNTIMGTSQIVNESSSKERDGMRIQVDISTASEEDVIKIKSLLIEATKKCKLISQNKYIKTFMTGFEQDILHFKVQCWIDDPEDKGYAKGELIESIYLTLDGAGIDVTMSRHANKISIEGMPPQELYVREFPETKQIHFVKEFPDTKQEHWIKEFPDTKQEHWVKEFPDTKQEHWVKEFPDTKQEHWVKEFPDTKQEHWVKEFPDTKQEHWVKEFPDTKQDMKIKEIPNLFGNGMPKQKNRGKNIMRNIKKDTNEK